MSRVHKVIGGDTLGGLAVRYLGSWDFWKKITGANPQLSSRKKAPDGSPLIYAGDTLIIPDDETSAPPIGASPVAVVTLTRRPASPPRKGRPAVSGRSRTPASAKAAASESPAAPPAPEPEPPEEDVSAIDAAIVIDGIKFSGWLGYELNLAYETFDTFSFTAPYDKSIEELRAVIMPFTFKPCEVYYGNTLLFKGRLLTPDPKLDVGASEITLQGYPLAGVLNDCMITRPNYPLVVEGITLKTVAEAACEPYGIPVVFDGDPGPPFTEISIEPTDKILDFLSKLTKQRGFLFTNNKQGQIVFFKPKQGSVWVTFTEGKPPLISVVPQFKPQDFFSHITGHSKQEDEHGYPAKEHTFENKYLINKGILRHLSITCEDTESGTELEDAVKAHAGRMFADCCTYTLTCDGHTNQDGKLFKKGMTVCVKAPSAMILKETMFIARNVKLSSSNEGKTAEFDLVFPGAYTGEIPETLPWE